MKGIVGLAETITDQEQERLTVDSQGGKSINPLRAFSGKGILVWEPNDATTWIKTKAQILYAPPSLSFCAFPSNYKKPE